MSLLAPALTEAAPHPAEAVIAQLVAAIDRVVTEQLNAVLHHPTFQRLEASWCGLQYLVRQVACEAEEYEEGDWDAPPRVLVRVFDLSWPELSADLARAPDFDRSTLFERIYTDEFDQPGGKPFGVLLCDHAVGHRKAASDWTDDIATLGAMSRVAAAAFAPVVASVAPDFLQLASFRDMPAEILPVFTEDEYAAWHALRDSPDSRFVALALPRVLMRLPWPDDGSRADGFRFDEDVSSPDASGWLWGSPVYALGAVLARAFLRHGWFGRIHGIERNTVSAGLVLGLPFAQFATDRPMRFDARDLAVFAEDEPAAPRIVTEVALGEEQAGQLARSGFLPLSAVPRLPLAAFLSTQTIQRAHRHDRQPATVSAQLSAKLGHVLCAARFAHCIKAIGRARLGSASTLMEHQRVLQDWLRQWCSANDDMSEAMRARFPLRDASAELREVPGKPGAYDCLIRLMPHFQFEDAVVTIRLATELRAGTSAVTTGG